MNLNQLTIPSRDLQKSIAFYQQLGLQLIVDSIPRYARFQCPDGTSSFSLHYTENFPSASGIWIYFECKNLDKKVVELQEAGIDFEDQITNQQWLWREIRLKDPDGHQLILYYAGENRLNPPWRVTSAKDYGMG